MSRYFLIMYFLCDEFLQLTYNIFCGQQLIYTNNYMENYPKMYYNIDILGKYGHCNTF